MSRVKTPAGGGKRERLSALKTLLTTMAVGSQEELLRALEQHGFRPTQATLSRDLKQLRVVKTAGLDGRYIYMLPRETSYRRVEPVVGDTGVSAANEGFVSITFSGNMAVVRTRPGYASSIAYNIDRAGISDILGTIAGDDTIFIVVRGGVTDEQVTRSLSSIIPALGRSNS